ncbi:MAG: OsmC family peroxiredoxin [Chryseobacterium sp.]|nr:MAG: OsmC family peroxiredoxin [Chryseobacterium sp.]
MLNNVNLEALGNYIDVITDQPAEAIAALGITATWKGGVNTEITTHGKKIGSTSVEKQFKYSIGEPEELLGDNLNPNPQDYILGGLAGCMMVGFVVGATSKGIKLDSVNLTIVGNLDLRGFLEIDANVAIGFEKLQFNFEVVGSGAQEDYDAIAAHVQKVSPGYSTIANPVQININKQLTAIV